MSPGPWLRPVTLDVRQVQRLRRLVLGLVAAVVVLGAVVAVTLPRALSFPGLLRENLELRQHLVEVDGRMAEVDRVLLRLRLYDAQLRAIGAPTGDYGPLDELAGDEPVGERIVPEYDPVVAAGVHPASEWAREVEARAESFLGLVDEAEPDLQQVLVELEDLRALEEALPSRWPVDGEITSNFGFRSSPFGTGRKRFHSGLDIANRRGTPIYAPAPGTVVDVSYNRGYGRVLKLDHGYGITTVYAHCNTIRVEEGERVREGDVLGTVGTTGRSTGPHLHFEVRVDGNAVDPLDYLPR